MTRRKYKPAYYDTPQESLIRATKQSTWASVMDAWRDFYNNGLINDDERKMLDRLVKKKYCTDCDKPNYEDELKRMNDLAKALKGNLDK